MAQKSHRTIVGEPLTPELLDDLGVLEGFSKPSGKFDPGADWTNTYRVWTCHGYRESGNADQGFLRVAKKTAPDAPNASRIRSPLAASAALRMSSSISA